MQRTLCIALTLALLSAAQAHSQTTTPATQLSTNPGETLEETKALEQKRWEEQLAPLPKLEPMTLAELFSLSIDNGELAFKPKLGATKVPPAVDNAERASSPKLAVTN